MMMMMMIIIIIIMIIIIIIIILIISIFLFFSIFYFENLTQDFQFDQNYHDITGKLYSNLRVVIKWKF